MQKISCIILAAVIVLALSACGKGEEAAASLPETGRSGQGEMEQASKSSVSGSELLEKVLPKEDPGGHLLIEDPSGLSEEEIMAINRAHADLCGEDISDEDAKDPELFWVVERDLNEKPYFDEDFSNGFEEKVMSYLKTGDIQGFSDFITTSLKSYSDDPRDYGLGISYESELSLYQMDIRTYEEMEDLDGSFYFFQPKMLASAFIFKTMDSKIGLIENADSRILPAFTDGKDSSLKEKELSLEEEEALLSAINSVRPEGYRYISARQYSYEVYGYKCLLTLVQNRDIDWRVWKMEIFEGEDTGVTAGYLRDMKAQAAREGRDFSIESFWRVF